MTPERKNAIQMAILPVFYRKTDTGMSLSTYIRECRAAIDALDHGNQTAIISH